MPSRKAAISVRAGLTFAFLLLVVVAAGCAVAPGHRGVQPSSRSHMDAGRGEPRGYVSGETVAVLLPESGRFSAAAEAVRAGILAAQRADDPSKRPVLRFYDTSNDQSAPALVRRAAAEGAQLVIGPLQKQAVDQLAASPSLPAPTLALNVATGGQMPPPDLYQFALSPEDEAAEVANRAWAKGYRGALMLYPGRALGFPSGTGFSSAVECARRSRCGRGDL